MLVDRRFWDRLWEDREFNNREWNFFRNNFVTRRIELVLKKYLSTKGKIIEFGCAHSCWLPYFYKKFGLEIWGIDFSQEGIVKTARFMKQLGIPAELLKEDFRSKKLESLYGQFDIVFSNGVIEHFEDYEDIVSLFSKFLKAEGIIVTLIPNLKGSLNIILQKILDRKLLDFHMLLDLEDIIKSHRNYFFQLYADYIGVFNLGVPTARSHWRLYLYTILKGVINRIVWVILNCLRFFPESVFFSPSIIYIGRKREGEDESRSCKGR